MELTVLGRSGRYPEKNGATSSYLLRCDDVTLLLDMGSGAISNFQNFIDIGDIDGILFSHLHGDHMADFLPFNYMVAYLKNRISEPIRVYLPREPKSVASSMVNGSTSLKFDYIDDGKVIDIGGVKVEFLAVKHPVECYAMKITYGGHTLLYTGDTTHFDGIEKIFKGVDVVLGDACVLDKDWTEHSPHISVKELAMLTNNVGARLILTHLPDNEEEISTILDEASRYNGNSEVAILKKTYTI